MAANKEYEKLKRKYKSLPPWDWLRKNFDVKIEEDGPVISQVKNCIAEKFESILAKIEPIISGAENFCCYYERRMLSQKQKDDIFELYKKMQSLIWKANAITVNFSEKDAADWVSDVKDFWEENRAVLVDSFTTISEGWTSKKRTEVETMYHG
ncbi:MAG: hypothetical protein QXU82_02100 [Candidatus Aenigmatarchaeota archaeon]